MNTYINEWSANGDIVFGPHRRHGQAMSAICESPVRTTEESREIAKQIALTMNLFPRVVELLKKIDEEGREYWTGLEELLKEIECELPSTATPKACTESANQDTAAG